MTEEDVDKLLELATKLVSIRRKIDSIDTDYYPSVQWTLSFATVGTKYNLILSHEQKDILKEKLLSDFKTEFSELESEMLLILKNYED